MAGQMGNKRVTIQNLEIVATDLEDCLIALKGAIPGARGSYIELRDAVKKQNKVELPFPAVLLASKATAKAEAKADVAAPAVESQPENKAADESAGKAE
jgi:large subunit ribosomal protein L3